MRPRRDKSVPHPGMIFFSGEWRSPEAAKSKRQQQREWKDAHREQCNESAFIYRGTAAGMLSEVRRGLRRMKERHETARPN